MTNALDLLNPEEVLKALKDSGRLVEPARAAVLVVALCSPLAAAAAPDFEALGIQRYETPKPAPDFALPDLDGRTGQARPTCGARSCSSSTGPPGDRTAGRSYLPSTRCT